MMKINAMWKFLLVSIISLLLLLLWGCNSEPKNARIEVYITDAPGDYEEVNIDIQAVEIHTNFNSEQGGWKPMATRAGIYDLLKLTKGLDTLIGSLELPAGIVSQVRFKLGERNTIKVKGKQYQLVTPSESSADLKLQVHSSLVEGLTYKLILAVDVARSIVRQENDSYLLKPVIRAIAEGVDGAIKDDVILVDATPAVCAIPDGDTVATAYTNATGQFMLRGWTSRTYTLCIVPNINL